MSPRPRRTETATHLQEAIKTTAWKQIAEYGAPALSLRAIARELGLTAPAIYNYFPRRDDLVTALIVDAFTSFGDWQIRACEAVPEADPVGRLMAIGLAYREWALTYPQRYHLIFGTPIPGYVAPAERVMPAAARSLGVLVGSIQALQTAGRLKTADLPQAPPVGNPHLDLWKSVGVEISMASLTVAILIWSHVHGLVSLEISKSTPPVGPTPTQLYEYELRLLERLFLQG